MVVQVILLERVNKSRVPRKEVESESTWESTPHHVPRRRVRTRSGCPNNHFQIFGRGIIQFSGVTGAKKLGSMGEIENKTDFRAVKGRTFQQWSLTKDGMG